MTEIDPQVTDSNMNPFIAPQSPLSIYEEPDLTEGKSEVFSGELVTNHQQEIEQLARPFSVRIKETFGTLFKEELLEPGQRVRRIGALAVAGGTQAAERMRIMAIALPTAFERSMTYAFENNLDQAQTIGLSTVAVGGLWAVWSSVVGKSFDQSVKAFPKTTETVMKNHPAMVGAIESAIDGFPKESHEQVGEAQNKVEVGPYDAADTKIGKFGVGVIRSIKTALLYGSTAHVGVSRVRNHSDRSVSHRLRAVVGESTAFFAALAAGVSAMVINNVKGAQAIQETVSNEKLLGGVSVGLIGISALGNYLARRKYAEEINQ